MKKSVLYKAPVLFSFLLSLQSCFVAREYSRPEEVVQEISYRTDDLPEDTLSMASISWREMFTDPILTQHIDKALQENLDVRVALQQIEAANAYLRQAEVAYFPSANGGFSAAHQELSNTSRNPLTPGSVSQFELSADVSWEIDIWGKIKSNERAVKASYLQSVAGHQAVKTQLIANIASLYYQLLALDQQLEITQETVNNRRNSLETIRALKQAGVVTEVGVQQTEAQLYRAQAVVVDLKNEIRLLENTFSVLMGDSPHEIRRSSLEDQQINTPLRVGVPLQLLRNRPDVIAAEYNLVNAFQLTNVARSEFYPSLSLGATAGLQSLDLGELLDTQSLFANLIGSISQPIFNRRQIRTRYEVAQAEQQIAYLDFRQTLLRATREVSDALYNYAAAQEKMEIKLQEAEAYDLATSYSEELLDNGLVNYLEVLTARENALNAQLELVNIRFTELNAVVNLYQALGGGWK